MKFRASILACVVVTLLVQSSPTAAFDASHWMRTYAGGYGHSVFETPDGGALLAGTFGAGFDCCRPWVIKIDTSGRVEWHTTYDAPGLAGANNMVPTLDGGYLLAADGTEFQVVKIDSDGHVRWARNYGDGGFTHHRVLEASDGSILLVGATNLGDGGALNGRAVLLDPAGNVLWQRVYGSAFVPDYFTRAIEGYDGNFLVVGSLRGSAWVLELDRADGHAEWQRTYGGPAEDTALAVAKVLKRYYLVVSASDTFANGGLRDWWVLLLNENGNVWREFALGGRDSEDPLTAIATSDGGFMIGGGTGSFGTGFSDIWLVKFDRLARIEWQKAYGRPDRTDHAWQILETADGYAVIGDTYRFPESYEFWTLHLDRDGNVTAGDCGTAIDTDAEVRRTRADVRDDGAPLWPDEVKAFDVRVGESRQTFPIEVCSPR